MPELLNVVKRAYDLASTNHPVRFDPLGPDPGWVPDIMIAVVRAALPRLGQGSAHQPVDKADVEQILAGFAAEWWTRTLELVGVIGPLCSEALRTLRDEHRIGPRGSKLRSLREKATGRIASYYVRVGRLPDEADRARLRDDLVAAALLSNHEAFDELTFRARMSDRYADQTWAESDPTPAQIRLGSRSRPPLCDPAFRTKFVGTDRDVYSRYKSYYDLRARSIRCRLAEACDDPCGIERFLTVTPTEQVAIVELDRASQPYGLRHLAHHEVLPVTLLAMSSAGAVQPIGESAEPSWKARSSDGSGVGAAEQPLVDGSSRTRDILARTYAGKFGASQWQAGINLADLEGYVMRRVWNDLHRWERETDSVAPRRWYVAQFKCALTQYPRERAVIAKRYGHTARATPTGAAPEAGTNDARQRVRRAATGEPFGSSTLTETVSVLPPELGEPGLGAANPDPGEIVHTAFTALGALDPSVLLDWLREAESRGLAEAVAMVTPVCRKMGFGSDAEQAVGFVAFTALRSMAPP